MHHRHTPNKEREIYSKSPSPNKDSPLTIIDSPFNDGDRHPQNACHHRLRYADCNSARVHPAYAPNSSRYHYQGKSANHETCLGDTPATPLLLTLSYQTPHAYTSAKQAMSNAMPLVVLFPFSRCRHHMYFIIPQGLFRFRYTT